MTHLSGRGRGAHEVIQTPSVWATQGILPSPERCVDRVIDRESGFSHASVRCAGKAADAWEVGPVSSLGDVGWLR